MTDQTKPAQMASQDPVAGVFAAGTTVPGPMEHRRKQVREAVRRFRERKRAAAITVFNTSSV